MAAKKMSDHTTPEKKYKEKELTVDDIEKIIKANPELMAQLNAATVKVSTVPPPGVLPNKPRPMLFIPSANNPLDIHEAMKAAVEKLTGKPWTEPCKQAQERPSRFEGLDDE